MQNGSSLMVLGQHGQQHSPLEGRRSPSHFRPNASQPTGPPSSSSLSSQQQHSLVSSGPGSTGSGSESSGRGSMEPPLQATAQSRQQQRCGRPGCGNLVGWGSTSDFCSNECVVGQCREVYSSWSSSSSGAAAHNKGGQQTATSQQASGQQQQQQRQQSYQAAPQPVK
jgi:hypothetical protein